MFFSISKGVKKKIDDNGKKMLNVLGVLEWRK